MVYFEIITAETTRELKNLINTYLTENNLSKEDIIKTDLLDVTKTHPMDGKFMYCILHEDKLNN